jgi:hypothetical protein
MGTIPSNSSIINEGTIENKNGDEISYDLDENFVIKHKVAEPIIKKDIQIRNEYLRKINEGLRKENEERYAGTNNTNKPNEQVISVESSVVTGSIVRVSYLDNIDNDYFESANKAARERSKYASIYKKGKRGEGDRPHSNEPRHSIHSEIIYVDVEANKIFTSKEDYTAIAKKSFGVGRKKNLSDINGDRITIETGIVGHKGVGGTQQPDTTAEYEMIFLKSAENLRRAYIAKLIYKNVWTPNKIEKDHNTIIIFDWDDTLLCTSFLTPNGIFNEDIKLSEKDSEKISKLETIVLRILTLAIAKGDTYIITNAAPGWVEYSVSRFYPSVKPVLEKVTIISARGDFERMYPGDSRMWKIQAFLNMQNKHKTDLVTNIICLGDSFIEMEAAHVLASKYQQAFIKTVKFRESPRPEELNKQLLLVSEQFSSIFSLVKNLTIRVEKKIK